MFIKAKCRSFATDINMSKNLRSHITLYAKPHAHTYSRIDRNMHYIRKKLHNLKDCICNQDIW